MAQTFTNPMQNHILGLSKSATLGVFATLVMTIGAQSTENTGFDQLSPASFEALGTADVVIVGEIHPNLEHRENQAAVVSLVQPEGLVFEMIDKGQGEAFGAGYRGADRQGFLDRIDVGEFGWKTLDQYLTILDVVPEAEIFGAASPRADLRRTVSDGAAAVFGEEAERYGLADPLPEAQQSEREALQMEAHCNALPEQMLGGMVEAQRFRDAAFARRIVEAFEKTGGPIVMITGNGHAREDWGIPAALRRAAPELNVLSIGQFEATDGDSPYDIHIKTAPFDEGDPCASFKTK